MMVRIDAARWVGWGILAVVVVILWWTGERSEEMADAGGGRGAVGRDAMEEAALFEGRPGAGVGDGAEIGRKAAGVSTVLGVVHGDERSVRQVRSWYRLGRQQPMRAEGLSAVPADLLSGRVAGEMIRLPWPGGREVVGRVRTVVREAVGLEILAGKLVSPRDGFFHFERLAGILHGRLGFTGGETVAVIFPMASDRHAFVEQPRGRTMCEGAQKDVRDLIGGLFHAGVIEAVSNLDPWNLQSLPGAPGVILLDFDGHTVSNTVWNTEYTDGDPIVAQRFAEMNPANANYKPEWILKVFNRCKEDFAPFNLNVTTSQAVFNAAPAGRRQRVIITPTSSWYPRDAGGVAYGATFTVNSDTPCWVWNGGIDWSMPETVSHEAGHTLGLGHSSHDTSATAFNEYYGGHGLWAPIMGDSFNGQRPYTQWDNGFFNGAVNLEDQIGIIADMGIGANNVGFRADDRGDTQATATVVSANAGGVIRAGGRIERDGDVDVYRFTMSSGTFEILGESHDPGPNAYLKLTLRNSAYAVIKNIVTDGKQPAQGAHTTPSGGTFYLEVTNSRRAATTTDQGFPPYGSLGTYQLELTEPGGDDERPVVASLSRGPVVFGHNAMEIVAVITDNKAVRIDTLAAGDLVMTRQFYSWTPALVSAAADSQLGLKKVRVTFVLTPPGGFWDAGDGGTYTLNFKSGAVGDTNGNVNAASNTLSLTVPSVDSNLPTVNGPDPWPATVLGATAYELSLSYKDTDTAFDMSSFDGGDVEVRSPEGEVLPVQLVTRNGVNFNRQVQVTYRVTPPGGSWDEDEIGMYTVKVRGGQVLALTGAAMAESAVGAFTHPGVIFSRDMSVDPGFTLGTGWAWGVPTGGGGTADGSGRDPAAGRTGSRVLGTNLTGNYAASTPVRTAISPVFSTTGYQKLSLNYWRWLNVVFDPVTVDYRVGSGTWKPLWVNDLGFNEEWSEATHPLPPECDNQRQVQVRWTIGPTAAPTSYRPKGGWNLDDIRVLADERFAPGRVLISWSHLGRFSLTEGGPSRTYILRLDQDPGVATPVTVNLGSSRLNELTHPASVVIDSTNWSTGRVVNVSAPQNSVVEGGRTTSIRHTLSSANAHFDGLVGPTLGVAILDDDEPLIRTQPTDRTLPQGAATMLSVASWPLSGTFSYQWYSGETGNTSRPVNGATSSTLNLTVGSGIGRYWVRVVRRVSLLATYVEDSRTAVVSPLSGYAAWKNALLGHGYTQAQLDAAGFDAADPESDGLGHLMEYALGGQPYTMDAGLLPRLVLMEDGPHFIFRRARADLDYTVQMADDPRSLWTDFVTNPGSVDAATDRDVALPASNELSGFARLRVSWQGP